MQKAAVVFAQSTANVADAVKLASEYNVPVIPFGVGTSLEGHLLARIFHATPLYDQIGADLGDAGARSA